MTITDAQIKLKPCPFCGGMGHFEFDDTHVAPYGHSVTCDSCAASSGSYRSVTRAAESWNTRALESRATPAPVAVDEAAADEAVADEAAADGAEPTAGPSGLCGRRCAAQPSPNLSFMDAVERVCKNYCSNNFK